MSKANQNSTGSAILFLGALTFSMVIILNNAPKDEHAPIQKDQPTEYNYSPIYYEYDNGGWGTHPNDPLTGELGVEIDSARIETLKLAD